MGFPSPGLTVPTLNTYQLSYRGLTFGGIVEGSAYQLKELPGGLDMPNLATGDVQRALDQGEMRGLDLSAGRDVEVDLTVISDGTSFDHARRALAASVGTPTGNVEYPLWLRLPSGTYGCMARPRKYKGPKLDVMAIRAQAGEANVILHATDPRWYAAPSRSLTVGLPAKLGGVSFGGVGSGIVFPVEFGGGSAGGLLNAENVGEYETRPVIIFTGPCTTPTVANLSVEGAPQLSFEISLAPGDTLEVETDFQTVSYTPAGAAGSASRRGSLIPGSTWFTLPPGENILEFTTLDPAKVSGTMTVNWASAFLGL